MVKKPKPKKSRGKPGQMIRVSAQDHAILTQLAKENNRTLSAENHIALMERFQKCGKIAKDSTPPSSST